jgi:uncharacterized repeat protein (TIGR03803 family)
MRVPCALQIKLATFAIGAFYILSTVPLRSQTVTVHVFTDSPDGSEPDAPLVQGRDGKLYGTTGQGGTNVCTNLGYDTGCGTIFNLDTSGNLTVLHSFDGTDGFGPQGVILASDGNFYGAAQLGGAYGFGTLFRITASGVFTKLHDFANGADGEYSQDQLLQALDGNLYGFTQTGLYRASPSGTITSLFNFPGSFPVTNNRAPLIQAPDGSLYSSMAYGYYNGQTYPCGSIVRFNLQGTVISEHDFGCSLTQPSGNFPYSALTLASDGNFYGTNVGGGSGSVGTAFKLNPQSNLLTVLHDYTRASESPYAGLIQGTDGNFYGVVIYSDAAYSGTVDQLTPAGIYTEVGDLPYHGEDFPYWSLIQHTSGKFYGSSWFAENQPGYYGSVYSFDNGLAPFITFVRAQGKIGSTVQILGQGFKGTTSVIFNGVPASSFSILSATYLTAVVPAGATSGPVTVQTSNRTLTSNKNFIISNR